MLSAQLSRQEQFTDASLCLPYRKDRNYIHSADIFQALTNLAQDRFTPEAYVQSLVLRRQACRQLRVSFQKEPEAVGTFSICAAGAQARGCLVESEADVLIRVPYDESRAAAAVLHGPGSARFIAPVPGYTAFEQLLVLLKAAGGQGTREAWLCQINLREPLLNARPLAVRLRQRALQRFFAFEIVQDERLIGSACGSLRS